MRNRERERCCHLPPVKRKLFAVSWAELNLTLTVRMCLWRRWTIISWRTREICCAVSSDWCFSFWKRKRYWDSHLTQLTLINKQFVIFNYVSLLGTEAVYHVFYCPVWSENITQWVSVCFRLICQLWEGKLCFDPILVFMTLFCVSTELKRLVSIWLFVPFAVICVREHFWHEPFHIL